MKIAERMFQALTDTDPRGRRIRRPARLSEIEGITGAAREQILEIIDRFRSNRRNFVNLYEDKLLGDVTIDISHESLIRQWVRLGDWVNAEADSRKTYMRIVDAAVLYKEGRTKLWRNPQLAYALRWREQTQPTRAWTARYNEDFDAAMAFLDKSRRRHRNIVITIFFVIPLIVFAAAGAITWKIIQNYNLAREAERKDRLLHIVEEQRDKFDEELARQNDNLLDVAKEYFDGEVVIYPHPIVGDIKLRRFSDGRMQFYDRWIENNIIKVEVPELREIAQPVNDKVNFNRIAAEQLQAAFREIKARGLLDRVLTWDNGFVRPDDPAILNFKRGAGGGPSTHALGIGFDLNRQYNVPGQHAAPLGQRGSILELVPVFRKFGFGWGGEDDATHFQFIRPNPLLTPGAAKD
jgi:hypothetical protein